MDGNTGPYLQYAYARIQSIFRRSEGDRGIGRGADRGHAVRIRARKAPAEVGRDRRTCRPGAETSLLVPLPVRPGNAVQLLLRELPGADQSAEPVRSGRLALCDLTARTLATGTRAARHRASRTDVIPGEPQALWGIIPGSLGTPGGRRGCSERRVHALFLRDAAVWPLSATTHRSGLPATLLRLLVRPSAAGPSKSRSAATPLRRSKPAPRSDRTPL